MENVLSESDIDCENTPPDITQHANSILENLLPEKSKNEYEKYYKIFMDWKQTQKTDSFSENVLIAFFGDLSQKWKSSTLWKTYSILKATIGIKHDIDISRYTKLKAFLKRRSDSYIAKKSKVFTTENVQQFLKNAPDFQYLATKVSIKLRKKNNIYLFFNFRFPNYSATSVYFTQKHLPLLYIHYKYI